MKKNYIYILNAVILIMAYACESYDDMIPAEYNKILSMKEVGERDITLYNTGEDGSFSITVLKGGYTPDAMAQAELSVMSEAELMIYSEEIGKAYKLLPSSLYELIDPAVSFTAQEHYHTRTISFKTTAINELLKQDASNYVLPVLLWSQSDSVNAEKNLVLLKPTVVIPKVGYEVDDASVVVEGNSIAYEFRLTLPFASLWDFECTVEVDPGSMPSGYEMIPNGLYTIPDGGKVMFKKGEKNSEPLTIKIKNADFFGNSYVIPLKITDITMQGFDLPESTFRLYGAFNKIHLTVDMLSTNAQEPNEGPIANLIDGDPATFFHTAWSYSISDPHHLQIKLDKAITTCKFAYQNRNNVNGKPQEVKILVSSNGEEWVELAHINSGMPTGAASMYSSETYTAAQPFTYFRFEVYRTNTGSVPTFFNMAEFTLFGK